MAFLTNGVWWYQWDPSKWAIAVMVKAGWVSGLKRADERSIDRARTAVKLASACLAQR